ncbi:MAG: NAD(P)-dependent oxidoreductase [Sneathiellaceae bacterium]
MPRTIVFGGAGFLGSHVTDALLARGHEVVLFDRAPSPWHGEDVRQIRGDICDSDAVRAAVEGCDHVYNFAGLADLNRSIAEPAETVRLNILGNTNILEACRGIPVARFVYASTVYVLSQKGAVYGATKKANELLIQEYGTYYDLPYTIVRYGSVYGPRADASNRVYRILRQALSAGRIDFPGDGEEEREYIHVRDAAKLSVDILDPQYRNRHLVLTGIERLKYASLLEMVREILNGQVEIVLQDKDYRGHYKLTPYSFLPSPGEKLVNNPSVDFGQGILECLTEIHTELQDAEAPDR